MDGGGKRIVLLDIKLELESDPIQVLPSGQDVHYYRFYPGGDHHWVRRGGRSTVAIDDDIHQIIILKNTKTVRVDDRFLPCLDYQVPTEKKFHLLTTIWRQGK